MFSKLDSEGSFWLSVLGIIAITIIAVALIISLTISAKTSKVQALLQEGHNPLEVQCALEIKKSNRTYCTILATKTNKFDKID